MRWRINSTPFSESDDLIRSSQVTFGHRGNNGNNNLVVNVVTVAVCLSLDNKTTSVQETIIV